jgi:hypothetical protein
VDRAALGSLVPRAAGFVPAAHGKQVPLTPAQPAEAPADAYPASHVHACLVGVVDPGARRPSRGARGAADCASDERVVGARGARTAGGGPKHPQSE